MLTINIPQSCAVNKIVAKDKFGSVFAKNTDIERIIWAYKLSPKTLNITATKKTPEVQLFTLSLRTVNSPLLAKGRQAKPGGVVSVLPLLKTITAKIPYPILFLVVIAGGHDSPESPSSWAGGGIVGAAIYFSDILFFSKSASIELKGNTVQTIFENFIRQIEPSLPKGEINEVITLHKQNLAIKKQIQVLKKKLKNELQDNKRQDLAIQIKTLTKQIKEEIL
jgi:hypothetical protein